MSTYLEICQAAARECGVAQGGTFPTAVTSQTGILNKIVHWAKDSWLEIQGRPVEWRWMRRGFTLNTTASQDTYAYTEADDDVTATTIARFRRWRINDIEDPAKCYLTSGGQSNEYWLTFLRWNDFKVLYKIGAQVGVTGQPSHITINPQNKLVIGPVPDADYTISGDFELGHQTLTNNDDEPDMPDDYHNLIMYETMIKYGYDQSSPELINRGVNYSNILIRQLEADQGEMLYLAEPMA